MTKTIIILISLLFLIIGNRIASRNVIYMGDDFAPTFMNARVTEIIEVVVYSHPITPYFTLETVFTHFYARITNGDLRGQIVEGLNSDTNYISQIQRELSVGDRIVLVFDNGIYQLAGFQRIHYVIILGLVFFAVMVIFGRLKGFNAVISLGLICVAVFFVFIPAILGGRNIYIVTVIISAYAIFSTLLIVIGVNKKALSAIIGCLGGVLVAGSLMAIMSFIMRLTGLVDMETEMIARLGIEIRALLFAGIIIGSVGAIMDVALSISSSLWEIKESAGTTDFKTMFRSGINIGRDIMGTMLNTLILAYIGSSISLLLLIAANSFTFTDLFNLEMVIIEFLRALIGSFGMLSAVPITAAVCAWFYGNSWRIEIGFTD